MHALDAREAQGLIGTHLKLKPPGLLGVVGSIRSLRFDHYTQRFRPGFHQDPRDI